MELRKVSVKDEHTYITIGCECGKWCVIHINSVASAELKGTNLNIEIQHEKAE